MTDGRRVVRRRPGRRPATASPTCTVDGQTVDLRLAKLDGDSPAPGRSSETIEPDRGVRPRARRPGRTGSSRPTELPALPTAPPSSAAPPATADAQRGAVTATYLERLAARSAPTGTVLCLGLDPDPGRPAGGLPAGPRGRRARSPGWSSRRPCRTWPRSSRTWPSSRRSGRRDRRPGATARTDPGRRPGHRRRASAATSARRPRARPWPCSTPSGWTP